MRALQLLFKASPAILLLVLCLRLGTSTAQEEIRQVMIMDLQMPQTTRANEEVTVKLVVKTELRECMVVEAGGEKSYAAENVQDRIPPLRCGKAVQSLNKIRNILMIKTYLVSSTPIDGPFNYRFTGCLCEDYPRTFYWDFQTNSTVTIAAMVDVIHQLNICPNNKAVIPIEANHFRILTTLHVD